MKLELLNSLPLTEHEQKIIIRVFTLSLALSIAAGLSMWVVRALKSAADDAQMHIAEKKGLVSQQYRGTRIESFDLEAHALAAQNFLETNQPQKALPHLSRIVALDPDNAKASLDLATSYLSGGQPGRALAAFRALQKDALPDSLRRLALARTALALFYDGQTEKSIAMLDRCLGQTPDFAEAACYRGQIEASLAPESDKAGDYFFQALEANANYAEAKYQLARFHMNKPDAERKEFLEARNLLLELLSLAPLHARAHARLGMVYYYLDQPSLAKKSYIIALALNPSDYNTRYNLGELLFSHGETKAALEQYTLSLEGYPQRALTHFRIGQIALEGNLLNEATSAFIKAASIEPNNLRYFFQLAVAYEKKGMPDKAAETYRNVLQKDALNAVARQKLRLLDQG